MFVKEQRGFTLVEVLAAIVVLGVVGIASTHLVLRLTVLRELTIRTEQRSLATRATAEQIWDLFEQSAPDLPDGCLPESAEPGPADFQKVDSDNQFEFAFRCQKVVNEGRPSDRLYRVRVWLHRIYDPNDRHTFELFARVGGY